MKATEQLSREDIILLYNDGGGSIKKMLVEKFGKDYFSKAADWMELWVGFCKKNNLSVILPHENPRDSDEESDNAYVMLRHIIKIKNSGWTPNWNDTSEYKYYPYFDMRSGSPFGFAGTYYDYWCTYTDGGSRLCFSSEKLAEETAKEFLPIYEKFMKK